VALDSSIFNNEAFPTVETPRQTVFLLDETPSDIAANTVSVSSVEVVTPQILSNGSNTQWYGLNPRGTYNLAAAYSRLDMVTDAGNSYVALRPVSGIAPNNDGINWQLMAYGAPGGVPLPPMMLTVSADGQTSFTLPRALLYPASAYVAVNGAQYTYGLDWNYNGGTSTLTWLGDFPLSVNDELIVFGQ
jgi:hypothetical protein